MVPYDYNKPATTNKLLLWLCCKIKLFTVIELVITSVSEIVKTITIIGGLLLSVVGYLLYSRYEKKYLSNNKSDKVA